MNGDIGDWIIKLNNQMVDIKDAFDGLLYRINDLEVKLENLRVQYEQHDHPYKSPPVYGGSYGH